MSEQQFTPYYQGQHYGAPYQQQYNRPLAPQGQYYQGKGNSPYAVSYTHLTLPTILRV